MPIPYLVCLRIWSQIFVVSGRYGQGAVLGAANPARCWALASLNEGALHANRQLRTPDQPQGEPFYTTALTTMVILQPGEAIDSPRVKSPMRCHGYGVSALCL
ncbi:MAG: hypothetical protein CM15mP120_15950 [Pseudomonadota bacterium]|nr:MAG: hypothetical protein CM15mP120_15950 [Pseudomonadota bacterium]